MNGDFFGDIVIHGLSEHRLYGVWRSMQRRCSCRKHKHYEYYGGRGIGYSEDWEDFLAFFNWAICNGWREGLELDRKDNDKNYGPNNCRFVTKTVNAGNRRRKGEVLYVGVQRHGDKFRAHIGVDGKNIRFKSRDTPDLALEDRNNYIIENNLDHAVQR